MTPTAREIEFRSYLIWEREGRPSGRAWEHWFQAEAELAGEAPEAAAQAPASPRTGTARKKPAAGKT